MNHEPDDLDNLHILGVFVLAILLWLAVFAVLGIVGRMT